MLANSRNNLLSPSREKAAPQNPSEHEEEGEQALSLNMLAAR